MAKYAENTSVSSSRSRDEIERTLTRYGATQFAYAWQEGRALIGFVLNDKQVRLTLPLPDREAREFTHTPTRQTRRSPQQQEEAYEQAVRQKWRALALVVKAKLEAVEAGISVFEREFFSDIVLPDGRTVGDYVLPQVEKSYRTGVMPPMLPALGSGEVEP